MEEDPPPPAGQQRRPPFQHRARLARLIGLCVAAPALYVVLGAAGAGVGSPLPSSVRVGVPFLLLPLAWFALLRQPPGLGKFDRSFLYCGAAYVPFFVWLALAIPYSPGTFTPAGQAILGGSLAAWWALDTFVHVGAVDYFTKRVVQHESELLFGPARAFALSVLGWSVGHVVEWMWLRYALGDAGAAAFLLASGVVTALAWARWRNVGGLMVGHFLLNVALAVAAVPYL